MLKKKEEQKREKLGLVSQENNVRGFKKKDNEICAQSYFKT